MSCQGYFQIIFVCFFKICKKIFKNKKPPTKKRLKVRLVHPIELFSKRILQFLSLLVEINNSIETPYTF